ncbi:retrovirus-related pol polyprotein from transposon TNT 1-94 [Tanacetum coccineum]
MVAGQRKPEGYWIGDERKAANLDHQLKSLIMSVLPDDQMNSVINCLTSKSTWDDLILYHEGPFDVKESRVMDLKLCYNTFKFKEVETLIQTFTRYKALMNKLVNDGIKLSKLEINTSFINRLPKKWLSFCQNLRNTNHVKSELASLFDSSIRVLNDLEEEYQARTLLAKSKRFLKKGTQSFSNAKATDQTKCHKCGKKGHFARDYWSKILVPPYQSPFQPKPLSSSQHKPKLRPTKDFEAKYNKVKAKLALLSLSASASKAATVKNKGLISKSYEWDEE